MNKHNEISKLPPPAQAPLVLVRTKESYKVWHTHLANVSKINRSTIGIKIDGIFLSLLELVFRATFACDKFEKLSIVSQSIAKTDLLKFFLQIGWEHKVLDYTVYGKIILELDEVGRMLGGWKKSLQDKTPTNK